VRFRKALGDALSVGLDGEMGYGGEDLYEFDRGYTIEG